MINLTKIRGFVDVSSESDYERAEDLGIEYEPELVEVDLYIDPEAITFIYEVPEGEWDAGPETMIDLANGEAIRVPGRVEDILERFHVTVI